MQKQLAEIVSWFAFWLFSIMIPAVLLYPIALWMAKHTNASAFALAQSFTLAVALLVLPMAFVIDFLYHHFVRDRNAGKSPDVIDDPK